MALKVRNRPTQPRRAVAELSQSVVAPEAEDAAHFAGRVVVVDMLGGVVPADGADAALLGQQLVDVLLSDAVSKL